MKRIISLVVMLCLCLCCLITAGAEEKKVGKIEVLVEPTKTEYWIGDTFSPEGGMIMVTYRDKTTEEISMTDDRIKIANVKTTSAGRKSVKISFGGKNTTLYIVVAEVGAEVTFDLNYDGAPTAEKRAVAKGKSVEAPEAPQRDGYLFDTWYTDANCSVLYDFTAEVHEAVTLYAGWKAQNAVYYPVAYQMNYYGVLPESYVQQVKEGETARELALMPKRDGFRFTGWFADADCTQPFSASETPIHAETAVYAGWEKTVGNSVYVFEAEQTNLLGKEGPGMSGSASGASMIVNDATGLGASGGKYVSYLYKQGLSLDFALASSEDVADATLTLRLAAEMENIHLDSENYLIEVNGEAYAFDAVAFRAGEPFTDAIVIKNVALKQGANTIRLITNNSVNPMGEGMGTYQGTAAMVDCIKLETTAVVIWDANSGLPMRY